MWFALAHNLNTNQAPYTYHSDSVLEITSPSLSILSSLENTTPVHLCTSATWLPCDQVSQNELCICVLQKSEPVSFFFFFYPPADGEK